MTTLLFEDGILNVIEGVAYINPKNDKVLWLITEKLPEVPDGKKLWLTTDESAKNGNAKVVVLSKTTEELNVEKQGEFFQKIQQIDVETQSKFTFFEFDSEKFSMSEKAQINWGQLMLFKTAGWYGTSQPITTFDDKTYVLTAEKVDNFMKAYAASKMTILSSGRLKKQTVIKQFKK